MRTKSCMMAVFAGWVGTFAACSSGSSGSGTTEATSGASSGSSASLMLSSPAAINAYLEGKTMVMTGADIPPYPLGYNENVNYGTATQCWDKITIQTGSSSLWRVTFVLGTLDGAAATAATGVCDNKTPSGSPFVATGSIAIANVQGSATCFDLDASSLNSSSGRGSISADGKTVSLELYINGQASGDTCADGAVGSRGVTLNGKPFTANAVQVYRIQ